MKCSTKKCGAEISLCRDNRFSENVPRRTYDGSARAHERGCGKAGGIGEIPQMTVWTCQGSVANNDRQDNLQKMFREMLQRRMLYGEMLYNKMLCRNVVV